MKIQGIYRGLGASIKIGLGFVPEEVECVGIGAANFKTLTWRRDFGRAATGAGGIVRAGVANTPGLVLLAVTAGVRPYAGGEVVGTASLAYQIHKDAVPAWGGNLQGNIGAWTLGSQANRTGCFNAGLNTTYSGVGSEVEVGGVRAYIVALTNDGDAANEVTLDRVVPSGAVKFVGATHDFVTAPVGTRMPAGIEILDVAHVNEAATNYSLLVRA